jgi:hypothetical protein
MPTPTEEKRIAMKKHLAAARVHVGVAASYQWTMQLLSVGSPEYHAERSLSTKLTNLSDETNSTLDGLNTE